MTNMTLIEAGKDPKDEHAVFREMFENATIGIFQSTSEGNYIRVNPMLARIYGYNSPKDLIKNLTNIEQQLYVDPGRRIEFLGKLLYDGQVSDFESEVYRRDGTIIWISESARLVTRKDGRLLYFEGFVKYISERKKLQQDLLDLAANLERRVTERTEELQLEIEKRSGIEDALRLTLKEANQATEGNP